MSYTPGDAIRVTAFKADGVPYRWWDGIVEQITPELTVVVAPPGTWVHQPNGGWEGRFYVRTYFWSDRWYNLMEGFTADLQPSMLYAHIASPAVLSTDGISYCDYELDVEQVVGQPVHVLDEDEYVAAAQQYGYTKEFQVRCRQAVVEAQHLITNWVWSGVQK